MDKFGVNAKCPKCGCTSIGVRYIQSAGTVGGNVMRRDCERCKYKWDQLPLDSGGHEEPEIRAT